MSGELQLRMEADEVTVTTYFKDLQNHIFGKQIATSLSSLPPVYFQVIQYSCPTVRTEAVLSDSSMLSYSI